MKTMRISISGKDGIKSIDIPKEFTGKDLFVTFTPQSKKKHEKIDIDKLVGVIQGCDISLDDVRYDRLQKK